MRTVTSSVHSARLVTIVAVLAACASTAIAQHDTSPAGSHPADAKAGKSEPRASRFLSPEHRQRALQSLDKAAAYLKGQQDQATGGWCVPKVAEDAKPQPNLPAITALALVGMMPDRLDDTHEVAHNDDAIAMGHKYLLNYVQPDGGIYDKILPSYNTALSISALSRFSDPRSKDAVANAVAFLRKLQWSESTTNLAGGESSKPVDKDHPFYGGVGYGGHGRPDNSNLHMFVQALQDAGVSPQDEAVQRALVFLKRTQMDERINDMPFAKGSRQGGFVYATVENAQSVDGKAGQSHANTIEETLSDGTKASRLRAYGSMTYAGFKTYVYAELPKDDLRVTAAYDWIRKNYTLDENPGVGTDGLYYYYVVFSRALAAWGDPELAALKPDGRDESTHRWADELVDKLVSLQNPDGSFKSVDDRWMENNPVLITAYSMVALRQCLKN